MKYLVTFLSVFFCIYTSNAQLSKQEKKSIKQTLKTFKKSPEKYKDMMDNMREEIDILEESVSECESLLSERDHTIEMLNQELSTTSFSLQNALEHPDCSKSPAGTSYRVQIGLFQSFSINDYLDESKNVLYEVVDGMNRYTIGFFDSAEEARQFRDDMKKMGIKDAFISEYINGERNMDFSLE